MTELEQARKDINQIDLQMAELFEKRMKACSVVADYKIQNGLSIKDQAREDAMIDANRKLISNPEVESYYVQFLRKCIDLSCDFQAYKMQGMKVAYCGTEGAYAQIAAKKMFPTAQLIACPSFDEAYKSVEEGKFDCAVLPIENSYAGDVTTVMDLAFRGTLYINQMYDLPISHNIMGIKGTSLNQVKKVVSHPQALSQCSNYIKAHGYETEPYSNTALAAKHVKEMNDPTIAAIASEETAELFGLEILEHTINDSRNNTTRFAVFSRIKNTPAASKVKKGEEKCAIVFVVKNEAGALARTLNIIGAHDFNMRNLRSRPMQESQWEYYFFIEAEGNINTQNGKDMLNELQAICAKVKCIGSYFDVC